MASEELSRVIVAMAYQRSKLRKLQETGEAKLKKLYSSQAWLLSALIRCRERRRTQKLCLPFMMVFLLGGSSLCGSFIRANRKPVFVEPL